MQNNINKLIKNINPDNYNEESEWNLQFSWNKNKIMSTLK